MQAFPKALRPAPSAVATVFPQVLDDQIGILPSLSRASGKLPAAGSVVTVVEIVIVGVITRKMKRSNRGPALSTMLLQNPPHLPLAGFDAFAEGELDAGAVQILSLVVDLEIDVAGEVVGEEAQSELEGDETDGVV